MSKIIGVTVGTPTSIARIEEELSVVKSVNGVAPDVNGNVEVETAGAIDLDATLAVSGKAADAKAVGDALSGAFTLFNAALDDKQPKGNYATESFVQTYVGEVVEQVGAGVETIVAQYVEQYISEALGGDY